MSEGDLFRFYRPIKAIRPQCGIGAFLLYLSLAQIAHAQHPVETLFTELQEKASATTFEIARIEEPILFRLQPFAPKTQEIVTVIRIEDKNSEADPLILMAQIFRTVERTKRSNSDLETITSFRTGDVAAVGSVKPQRNDLLPYGTKVVSVTDSLGNLKDAKFVPPAGISPDQLPKPGSNEFNEALKYAAPTAVFPAKPVAQGGALYSRLLFPVGLPKSAVTNSGSEPFLAGRTPCGSQSCFVIKIDETMETVANDAYEMRAQAIGYMLISEDTFDGVETIFWTHSEIKSSGKDLVQDMVVLTRPSS